MHLNDVGLNIFISNSPHNIQPQALLSPTTLSNCNSVLTVVGKGELLVLQPMGAPASRYRARAKLGNTSLSYLSWHQLLSPMTALLGAAPCSRARGAP